MVMAAHHPVMHPKCIPWTSSNKPVNCKLATTPAPKRPSRRSKRFAPKKWSRIEIVMVAQRKGPQVRSRAPPVEKKSTSPTTIAARPPDVQLVTYWGRAVAAAIFTDAAAAQDALRHYDELTRSHAQGPRPLHGDGMKDETPMVQAWAATLRATPTMRFSPVRAVATHRTKLAKPITETARPRKLADLLLDCSVRQEATDRIRNFTAHRPKSLQRSLRRSASRHAVGCAEKEKA